MAEPKFYDEVYEITKNTHGVRPGEVLQTSLALKPLDDSEAVQDSIETYSQVINYGLDLPSTSSSTATVHHTSQAVTPTIYRQQSIAAASAVPTVSLHTSPPGRPHFRFVHLPTTSASVRASLSTPTANVHTSRPEGRNFRFVRLPGITPAAVTPHRSQPITCVRPPSQQTIPSLNQQRTSRSPTNERAVAVYVRQPSPASPAASSHAADTSMSARNDGGPQGKLFN